MVYAYKNRGNYNFLNFIFSSGSFNDAIKRLTYLKSYRNYREMQGENILRTQLLRKQRVEELTGTKQKKSVVLQDKDKEMSALEGQQKEKDKILNELKKQGKELNNQYAAKRKLMLRVDNAIKANVRRALEEAKKVALKTAADAEAKRIALEKANAKANANTGTATTGGTTKPVKAPTKKVETPTVDKTSVLLNSGNIVTNTNFINSKGTLPWPVDKGYVLMHFGTNHLPSGSTLVQSNTTIATDIGSPVKSSFDGVVTAVIEDEGSTVMIQHGRYFTTYSNLGGVSVKKGQTVTTGQVIGKALANLDGVGAIEFYLYDEKANYFDPEKWLRRR
jgi:murein hydrolase activator